MEVVQDDKSRYLSRILLEIIRPRYFAQILYIGLQIQVVKVSVFNTSRQLHSGIGLRVCHYIIYKSQ